MFPQFGIFGNLKKHWFVRDLNWKLVNEENNQNDLFVEYEYVIAKDHFLDWKHSAKLNLKASVINNLFNITIQILNIGDSAFEFTGGLHPYFKINSRSAIKINGLESTSFKDSFPVIRFELSSDRVIERLYFTNKNINFYNGSDNLVIKSKGFECWMIWNLGKEGAKNINDLPDEDRNKFLCIEPIVINNATFKTKWNIQRRIGCRNRKIILIYVKQIYCFATYNISFSSFFYYCFANNIWRWISFFFHTKSSRR